MSEQRQEFKVGLFVFIGLVLIGALMLYFSKGQSLFKPTYTIFLKTGNVGGLKAQASVMLSGVKVGGVDDITLSPDGKTATVELKLLKRYTIHGDAEFTIDSLGFLGDQYVAIRPTKDAEKPLQGGEIVEAKPPFDLQELARAALGFVNRIDTTAQNLNDAIKRVDRMVLNEQTLTNLAMAFSNFLAVSERAIATVDQIGAVFETNKAPISVAMTNLVVFSKQLNGLADELRATVETNRLAFGKAVENVEKTTESAREVMVDLRAGRGVVGGLLHDEQLKLEMSSIMTNLNATTSNLNILSSNINNKGLWSVLWKPKQPKNTESKERSGFSGKHAR